VVPPGHETFNDNSVNLSLSYEVDIWGRLRRATESARASLLGSEEGRRTVVLTLVSTVANGYIQLRALDRQLEIARSTSQSLGEAARLQQVRFREGAVPESDYKQAESQYQTAAAQVPSSSARSRGRRISSASCSAAIRGPSSADRTSTRCFPAVPEGLPATLLERRPTSARRRQNLVAANANIGVAKAAYFPRISLTALFGFESTDLSSLFKGPSRAWSFGAGVTVPIFNGGLIRNQVAQTEASSARCWRLTRSRSSSPSRTSRTRWSTTPSSARPASAGEERRRPAALPRPRRPALPEGATIYSKSPPPNNPSSTPSSPTSPPSPCSPVLRQPLQGDGRRLGRRRRDLAVKQH